MGHFTSFRHAGGYTLIETLAGGGVSAVLATLGVPTVNQLLDAQTVAHAVSGLSTAMRFARAEAMKRGEVVTVCARDPSVGDQGVACLPSGKDWSGGLLVFVDRAPRGHLDDDDLLLQVQQPTAGSPWVTATLRYMSFQSSGVSLTAASHFDYVPHRAPAEQFDAPGARRLCINKPGRIRQIAGGQACSG